LYSEACALSQLVPGISGDLESLVHAMLAKNPAERPPMKQIAAELKWLEYHGGGETGMATIRRLPAPTMAVRRGPGQGVGPVPGPGNDPERRPASRGALAGPARYWAATSGALLLCCLALLYQRVASPERSLLGGAEQD